MMKIAGAIMIIAAGFLGGCAEWKEEAMKEPNAYRDPVTGEPTHSRTINLFESG